MTKQPADSAWAFLDPHFQALNGLLRVVDPDRLDTPAMVGFGRDPETDWWLRVHWVDHILGFRTRPERQQALRRVREALLLVSVLAHVDSKLWVKKLCQISGFKPARFMDLTSQPLRPHFQLSLLGGKLDAWAVTMQFLCGRDAFSEGFVVDLKRAMQLAGASAFDNAWRPQLQLSVSPLRRRTSVPLLDRDVQQLNDLEEFIHHLQALAIPGQPRFVLSSLVLDTGSLVEDSLTIEVLRRVIDCGVPIQRIRMPDGSGAAGNRESPEWREAWIKFVCSLCGQPMTPVLRPIAVTTISVSSLDINSSDFVLLATVLIHARGVRHLEIEDPPDLALAHEPLLQPAWSLLGLALVSRDSSTSVDSLSVRGASVTADDVGDVFDTISLWYPLAVLYDQWMPNAMHRLPMQEDPTIVHIPVGTTIRGYYGIPDEPYTIITESVLHGIVLDEHEEELNVMIMGHGFCAVAQSAVPPQRTEFPRLARESNGNTSSLLKHIELVTASNDATSREQLDEFLEFAGGLALQSLRLHIPNLTEESVRSIFTRCPNLQHLGIASVSLPSMNAFEEAFDAGVRLQSLELNRVDVPRDALVSFVAKYCGGQEPDAMVPAIPNLRLGLIHATTLQALDAVLAHSHTLHHLEYTLHSTQQEMSPALVDKYHSRSVGLVREPLAAENQLAFLGGLLRLTRSFPQLDLTDEIKASICLFAATPQTRTVVCSPLAEPQTGAILW